jgi:hypothetical protein
MVPEWLKSLPLSDSQKKFFSLLEAIDTGALKEKYFWAKDWNIIQEINSST